MVATSAREKAFAELISALTIARGRVYWLIPYLSKTEHQDGSAAGTTLLFQSSSLLE